MVDTIKMAEKYTNIRDGKFTSLHGNVRSKTLLFASEGSFQAFCKALVEAELSATKEKLEAAEKRIRESQEQEPVSWRREWDGDTSDLGTFVHADNEEDLDVLGVWEPLYTMPPIPPEIAELQRENAELRKQLNEFDSIGLAICALASNSGIEEGHEGWALHVGRLREHVNTLFDK